ncbi:unnamed protein product [Linum trigynum]|uniref:Uncharacterized protein n=1 Tax=Linum trigynum TaxID=586398 RepID=A0AAV2E9E2_9ROSI
MVADCSSMELKEMIGPGDLIAFVVVAYLRFIIKLLPNDLRTVDMVVQKKARRAVATRPGNRHTPRATIPFLREASSIFVGSEAEKVINLAQYISRV